MLSLHGALNTLPKEMWGDVHLISSDINLEGRVEEADPTIVITSASVIPIFMDLGCHHVKC